MPPSRHFLIPTPFNGSRGCDPTSRPTCVLSAILRTHDPFLLACNSRNRSIMRHVSAFLPYPDWVIELPCPIYVGQFAPLAP
jgi:hypothetical protein